jgi:TrmH family RNA methyltransferase
MLDSRHVRRISSRQNPLVQAFRELARTPEPGGRRLLLDGAHLVQEALAAGLAFETVVVSSASLQTDTDVARLARALDAHGVDVVEAPDEVCAAISPLTTPSGLTAIGLRPSPAPGAPAEPLWSPADVFVLAAVDVQDPGNVGGLLRTAEAGGVTGVLVCGASANPFAWKALRGSMGSAFRLPVVTGQSAADAIDAMRRHGVTSIAAVARGGSDPDAIDWRGRVGLVLGGEGPGLSPDMVALCDRRVTVPMTAPVESLNVGASAAVLIYAARRQRA